MSGDNIAAAHNAIAWGEECEALHDGAICIGTGARSEAPGEVVIARDGVTVLRVQPGGRMDTGVDFYERLAAALRVAVRVSIDAARQAYEAGRAGKPSPAMLEQLRALERMARETRERVRQAHGPNKQADQIYYQGKAEAFREAIALLEADHG